MRNFYLRTCTRFFRTMLGPIESHAKEPLRTRIWNALLADQLGLKGLNIRSQSYIKGLQYITIGENFNAGRGLWLEAIASHRHQTFSPSLVIGDNVGVAFWSHIAAIHLVVIGNNVLIGSKVLIIDHNHGNYGHGVHDHPNTPPADRPLSFGPILIGSNVWIGDGVVVTPNSTIGSGCIIGANAVVVGEIPPNTIAVGAPARPIKVFDLPSQQWIARE